MVVCPLCSAFETKMELSESVAFCDYRNVRCRRCGQYRIDEYVAHVIGEFEEEVGIRLSGLARLRTDDQLPRLYVRRLDAAEIAKSAPIPQTATGFFDRVIEQVATLSKRPGRHAGPMDLSAMAARMFLSSSEFSHVAEQLRDTGLLHLRAKEKDAFVVSLSVEGWRRADELARRGPRSNRAFVAMWFHPDMRSAYLQAMEPALVEAGYERPFRVDDEKHDELVEGELRPRIDDRILAEIRRARFVVADVTGGRQAVYFEAGFAEGLGIPVIWCCRAGNESDMSFDTRQIEHILWNNPEDLKAQLAAKIGRRGWTIRLGT